MSKSVFKKSILLREQAIRANDDISVPIESQLTPPQGIMDGGPGSGLKLAHLPQKVGYAHVFKEEPSLTLQIEALKAAGCTKIFCDQGSSIKKSARPGLTNALNSLQQHDEFIVWKLDRLGKPLAGLIKLINELGSHDIGFRSLHENIDTGPSGGELTFPLVSILAEFDRTLISERTKIGMRSARALGKRIGRPPSLSLKQCASALQMIGQKGKSVQWVAEKFNVSERTLRRLINTRGVGH